MRLRLINCRSPSSEELVSWRGCTGALQKRVPPAPRLEPEQGARHCGAAERPTLCRPSKSAWMEGPPQVSLQSSFMFLPCSFLLKMHTNGHSLITPIPTWFSWDASHAVRSLTENELALCASPDGPKLCSVYVYHGSFKKPEKNM